MPEPSRKGYTFKYWKGSRYKAGDTYRVTEDHTLTAEWKKDSSVGGDGSRGVRTGDDNHILSWVAMLLAAMLGLILSVILRIKQTKRHRP